MVAWYWTAVGGARQQLTHGGWTGTDLGHRVLRGMGSIIGSLHSSHNPTKSGR